MQCPVDGRCAIDAAAAAVPVAVVPVVFEIDCFVVTVLIHSAHNPDSFKLFITLRYINIRYTDIFPARSVCRTLARKRVSVCLCLCLCVVYQIHTAQIIIIVHTICYFLCN